MKKLSEVINPIWKLFKSFEIAVSINVDPDYHVVDIYMESDYVSLQHIQSVNNIIDGACAVSYSPASNKFYITFKYED